MGSLSKGAVWRGLYLERFLSGRSSVLGGLSDRDPHGQGPPEETLHQRQRPSRINMGPGSQIGSDIIQRPPLSTECQM